MTSRLSILIFVFAFLGSVKTLADSKRDTITVVGSSTVFPFSKVVAERFGRKSRYKAPKIEPTGTGGGFNEFCRGLGIGSPDIVNASRKIKAGELNTCRENGVRDIIEIHFGYDGIVMANSVDAIEFDLTPLEIFLALAKRVPDPEQQNLLIENPYQRWSDINSKLPAIPITVFGPPPTSGTRDAFTSLAMEGGCLQFEWIRELSVSDKHRFKAICHRMREDGAFINAGENDNLIVRKLNENADALGIFGYSFLDQNTDKVRAAKINGQQATSESISNGNYIVSRPLYFYVKKAHIQMIPGVREFLLEFLSEPAIGDNGYLGDKGLIPLSMGEREEMRSRISDLKSLPL